MDKIKNIIIDEKIIIKFLLVGILNFIFGYSVYFYLIVVGVVYSVAFFVSTIAGICFNYFTIKKFVFSGKRNAFVLFVIIYILQFLLGLFLIKEMTVFFKNELIAGLLSMMVLAILSFILMRKIFNEK